NPARIAGAERGRPIPVGRFDAATPLMSRFAAVAAATVRSRALLHELPHEDRQPSRSSARGKARNYSIPMADDLTEARRQLVARTVSARDLMERSIAAAEAPPARAAFVATSFAAARAGAAAAERAIAAG